jgi:hypothetical protein
MASAVKVPKLGEEAVSAALAILKTLAVRLTGVMA